MKPIFYIVITGSDTYRFASRTVARAFAAACKIAGYNAIVKAIF